MTIAPPPPRRAVIDIGSNSVRLVVYGGPPRAPVILFNEKVMAALGAGLVKNGRIGQRAINRALAALDRFAGLCAAMAVEQVRMIATAAVRDASNGPDFVEAAAARGHAITILSGDEEARCAGLGVLSAWPQAEGLVADLGGGSLELVMVAEGTTGARLSLPLGVLRIGAVPGVRGLDTVLRRELTAAGWTLPAAPGPIYLVGGSWRSLARVDMHSGAYPMRVVDAYTIAPSRALRLAGLIAAMEREALIAVPFLSKSRVPTLPPAAALLSALTRVFAPTGFIISSQGLREGLLFAELDAATRAMDPLLAATAALDEAEARFPAHGRALARWIAPLFADEAPALARLRAAACNLGDVAWRANPDFRAERGLEIALHGNWVGVNAVERAMLGQTIFSCFGGGCLPAPGLTRLAAADSLHRAALWGLAMRLGQRLSGGTEAPLDHSRLSLDSESVALTIGSKAAALAGEAVTKRLNQLAAALKLQPVLTLETSLGEPALA